MDNIEEYIKKCGKYAKKNGFKLNPNSKSVEGIVRGLFENEKKYGAKYCPCRRISGGGNETEDAKKICPCIYHKSEIEKDGHCFCQLYWK